MGDESAVVVEQGGDVREEVLWAVDAVRGLVAVKVVAEAHLEGLHEDLEQEEDGREGELVAGSAGVAHALELGHLQVEQLDERRVPFLAQRGGHGGRGRGPVHLAEDGVEVGREGGEDLGAQGLGDAADVVEQLGRGALCVVLQPEQAGVQGAQLLVRVQGSVAGRVQLRLGIFAQHVDVVQQGEIAVGDVEAVQRVEDGREAGHGVVAGVAGGHDAQAGVDVGLLAAEGEGALLPLGVVGVGGVFGRVQVALGGVELLLEHGVLGGDGAQQRVQRGQVARVLQLVVEEVEHARLVVVHGRWRCSGRCGRGVASDHLVHEEPPPPPP